MPGSKAMFDQIISAGLAILFAMLLLWVLLAQTSGFTLYEHLWDKWRSGCACCDRRRKPASREATVAALDLPHLGMTNAPLRRGAFFVGLAMQALGQCLAGRGQAAFAGWLAGHRCRETERLGRRWRKAPTQPGSNGRSRIARLCGRCTLARPGANARHAGGVWRLAWRARRGGRSRRNEHHRAD